MMHARTGSVAAAIAAAVSLTAACHSDRGSSAPDALSAPSWAVGHRYLYSANLTSQFAAETKEIGRLDLTSDLEVSPTLHAGNKVELRAVLRNTHVRPNAPAEEAKAEALRRELAAPFFIVTESGHVVDVFIAPSASASAIGVFRSLASTLQVAPGGGSEPWKASESDATGPYAVEYRYVGEPGRFEKRKLKYGAITAAPGAATTMGAQKMVPELKSSVGQVALHGGNLEFVRGTDEVVLRPAAGVRLDSKTSFELVLMREDAKELELPWAAERLAAVRVAENRMTLSDTANPAFDAERIGDLTFEGVVRALASEAADTTAMHVAKAVEKDPDVKKAEIQSRSRYFVALTAMVRRDPKVVDDAMDLIRRGSPVRETLLDALGSSDDARAQASLAALVKDGSAPPALRQSAAYSLIRTHRPTDDTVRTLIALIGDPVVGQHGVYGLGTAARHLREGGRVAAADAASHVLLDYLAHARGDDVIHALRGLANAGAPGAVEPVRPYLEGHDIVVRSAAIEAIRLVPGPAADELVARALGDSEEEVRMAALDAAKPRQPSPTLAVALDRIARSDETSRCRERAIQLMSDWLPERPELRGTLEYVAGHDARDAVREAAQNGLDSAGTRGG